MRPLATLCVAILLTLAVPAAAALPVQDPGAGGEGGPCGDDPCFQTFPVTQDPVPLGPDVTKLALGGECQAGSYAFACETEQCLGSFWVFGPCRGTTTCYAFVRTTCVAGLNQEKAIAWGNVLLSRQGAGSDTLPSTHLTAPGVGIGGDCADHDVAVSCNYHLTEADTCVNLAPDPTEPEFTRPCRVNALACQAYAVALEGCIVGLVVYNIRAAAACIFEPTVPACETTCRALADLSITLCSTEGA